MADDSILDTIVHEVKQDGVYIAPAMRQQVDATEEAAIEEAVARIDTPVHVIALPLRDDDMFGGSAADLLTRVHDQIGGDGWYVAPSYTAADGTYYLHTEEWAGSYSSRLDLPYDADKVAEDLHPTDLGAGLVELTTAIADGTVSEKVAETTGATTTGSPADDGPSTGVVVGGLSVVLALVVAVVLLRRRSRNLTGARQAVLPASRRHYTLPESVLERVREADADRIAARADRAMLALGERIDATAIGAGADTTAWQSALDHYDAARRVSDTDDLLDDVGALVLAERGEAALDAALAGRPFTPTAQCFLNPLHGRATARRQVDHGGRRLDVPLCTSCRRDLGAGRTPDILGVTREGKPVHYFDADAEPWSSTGYGALEPDLVERLHRLR